MGCQRHYFSEPALTQDAMLSTTKIELKLILDAETHLFFKKSMRGGVFYISKRYIKANKKYLKPYDPKQE